MTNKALLAFFLFSIGCQPAEILAERYEAIEQPTHYTMCGPSGSHISAIYVESITDEGFDTYYLSDIVVIETNEDSFVLGMNRDSIGELSGTINIPYLECGNVENIVFLAGA